MSEWASRNRPLEEREYPDPDEGDDDCESYDSLTCPECGESNYEDSEACSGCGYFFVASDRRPHTAAPFGWIGVMIVALLLLALSGMLLLS